MYESIIIYLIAAIVFENAGGMLYGVAAGFDLTFVFVSTMIINMLTAVAASLFIDRLLAWKQGWRGWIERRTARGQRLIHKYAWLGIIAGTFVLSPIQTAVIGRLLCIAPRKFYPPLLLGIVLDCFVAMAAALGIFKLILGW